MVKEINRKIAIFERIFGNFTGNKKLGSNN